MLAMPLLGIGHFLHLITFCNQWLLFLIFKSAYVNFAPGGRWQRFWKPAILKPSLSSFPWHQETPTSIIGLIWLVKSVPFSLNCWCCCWWNLLTREHNLICYDSCNNNYTSLYCEAVHYSYSVCQKHMDFKVTQFLWQHCYIHHSLLVPLHPPPMSMTVW